MAKPREEWLSEAIAINSQAEQQGKPAPIPDPETLDTQTLAKKVSQLQFNQYFNAATGGDYGA